MKGLICLLIIAFLELAVGQRGPCIDATMSGGIYYSYDETGCSQYRQCHQNTDTENVVVYKSCPYGQYWNQATFQCQPSALVNCPIAFQCSGDRKMENEGCRSYWMCQNFREVAACCPAGTRFVPGRGCSPDLTCLDPCPGPCGVNEVCQAQPDWGRSNYYYYNDADVGRVERICRQGSIFDVLECDCVAVPIVAAQTCRSTNQLNLAGNLQFGNPWLTTTATIQSGELYISLQRDQRQFDVVANLPEPSVANPLVIMFRYREQFPATGRRNLLTTDDCKACNLLSIDLVDDRLVVTLTKRGQEMATVSVVRLAAQRLYYHSVVVMYNGKELLLIVRSDNQYHMKRVEAPQLTLLKCGIHMAAADDFFSGYLTNFALYSCNPGGRAMDLIPFGGNDVV